jgi:hypothetical protein
MKKRKIAMRRASAFLWATVRECDSRSDAAITRDSTPGAGSSPRSLRARRARGSQTARSRPTAETSVGRRTTDATSDPDGRDPRYEQPETSTLALSIRGRTAVLLLRECSRMSLERNGSRLDGDLRIGGENRGKHEVAVRGDSHLRYDVFAHRILRAASAETPSIWTSSIPSSSARRPSPSTNGSPDLTSDR